MAVLDRGFKMELDNEEMSYTHQLREIYLTRLTTRPFCDDPEVVELYKKMIADCDRELNQQESPQ